MSARRLCLGTAQFGLENYGIRNTRGKPDTGEVEAMVGLAWDAGVRWIDTAQAYGDAEEQLGKVGVSKFRIVTKIAPNLWDDRDPTVDDVRVRIGQSIQRLGAVSDVVLLHSARYAHRRRVLAALAEAVAFFGPRVMWGVSCYNPDEAHAAIVAGATAVQVPLNLLDLRAMTSGVLVQAERRGVQVFARAPFLQGLLCDRDVPAGFTGDVGDRLDRLHWSAVDARRTMADVALSAALQAGDHVVTFGCERVEQLLANLATAELPVPQALLKLARPMRGSTEAVVNPSLWGKS